MAGWFVLYISDVLTDSYELTDRGFIALFTVWEEWSYDPLDQDFWTALVNLGLLPAVLVYAFGAGQVLLGTVGAVCCGTVIVLVATAVAARGVRLDERARTRMGRARLRGLVEELRASAGTGAS